MGKDSRARGRKALAWAVASLLGLAPAGTALAADATSWMRLAGNDRYETMGLIVKEAFNTSGTAVLASGATFADALSASALAGALSCPVVLTEGASLSAEAASEIARIGASEVWIVGGEASVSAEVTRALEARGVTVTRVWGNSRSETSAMVASAVAEIAGTPSAVVIASGSQFADALSIAPYAWATASPVLLVEGDATLGTDAADALTSLSGEGVSQAIICGGTNSVDSSVDETLSDGRWAVERLGGPDRYDTSRRIACWELEHGLAFDSAVVASGRNFPDALAGSALAGVRNCPLLLAEGIDDAQGLITLMGRAPERGYVLGGTTMVADPVGDERVVDPGEQQAILDAAKIVEFPGPGLCATWVADVYEEAGFERLYGDARDMYAWYGESSRWQDLKPGMIIAVAHHPYTTLGAIYGHVGIYMGDGIVRNSGTEEVKDLPLMYWLDHYGQDMRPRWGMPTS